MKTPKPYYEQDKDELFETIIRCSLDEGEDDEVDLGDALHVYFDMVGPRNWCDVRDEAFRIAERLYEPEGFEPYSPIDSLLAATAAQGADGVWQTIAEAFGLDKKCVEIVLDHWYEKEYDTAAPAPVISWEEFMRRYEEWKKDSDAPAEMTKEKIA